MMESSEITRRHGKGRPFSVSVRSAMIPAGHMLGIITAARRRECVRPARPRCAARTRGAVYSFVHCCLRSRRPRDTLPEGTTSTAMTKMRTTMTAARAAVRPPRATAATDSWNESRRPRRRCPRMVARTMMKTTTKRPPSLRACVQCDRRRAAYRRTLRLAASARRQIDDDDQHC